jgi:hypothetical protein
MKERISLIIIKMSSNCCIGELNAVKDRVGIMHKTQGPFGDPAVT